MAKNDDGTQDEGIQPSTEFDGMDVRKIPEIDRSKWMAITNMIHYEGRKTGITQGYKEGVESYTLSYRFWFNTGTFISGLAVGMTLGSVILVFMLKGLGAL